MTSDSEVRRTRQQDRVVTFGNRKIALGGFALLLMLIAILVPPVQYSLRLSNPTPPQLLVAISIAMFASVLYLWVLDVSDTVRFRSVWVSRGVYGAAIVSILGTSVGVYKDAFVRDPFPHEGEWLITVADAAGKELVARRPVGLVLSRSADVYWGYAAPPPPRPATTDIDTKFVQVTAFDPQKLNVELELTDGLGWRDITQVALVGSRNSTMFAAAANTSSKYRIQLARRN